MNKYLGFGGVLYAGVGTFLGLAVYLRGNESAYTNDLPWYEALEVALTWPWELLKFFGLAV